MEHKENFDNLLIEEYKNKNKNKEIDSFEKSVNLHVLGCRVNMSEGESILSTFSKNGYDILDKNLDAQISIIHTCTVTNKADSKSRQLIRKIKRKNKATIIVVTGCYAQTSPGELLNMDEVDLVIGIKDRERIVEIVETYIVDHHKMSIVGNLKDEKVYGDLDGAHFNRNRAFIKIEEGCESFCTYCIIPRARGPIRSKPLRAVLDEINLVVREGFCEIVLTGTHIGPYGSDFSGENKCDLVYLVREILKIQGLKRIRFGSIDPNEITEEFIELFTDPKVLNHLHLALQSGDNQILRSMRRKYDTDLYLDLVKKFRNINPNFSITTDIMVGYPGESELNHKNSLDFIKCAHINSLHIFQYSKRKHTKAANMENQVSSEIKKLRAKEMEELSQKLGKEYRDGLVGQREEVLIESHEVDQRGAVISSKGYSRVFEKVEIFQNIPLNTVVEVEILETSNDGLIGGLVNE